MNTPVQWTLTTPSILFDSDASTRVKDEAVMPGFFSDLNLDQVVDAMTAGREDYDLKPFFYARLNSVASVQYRQAVFQDLKVFAVVAHLKAFAQHMLDMREQLAIRSKVYHELQKQRWFLEAVDTYCVAVRCLVRDLGLVELHSQGLLSFRAYLTDYAQSPAFTSMVDQISALKSGLTDVRYRMHIEGPRVEVSRYDSEPDYGEQVTQTFEKFRQGPDKSYVFDTRDEPQMNHVEAAVLERVAQLNPQVFDPLEKFCQEHAEYLNGVVRAFDREVQFYLAVLDLTGRLDRAGLEFCLPKVDDQTKAIDCRDIFDLSLAIKMEAEASRLVRNSVRLEGAERIVVVSGANQGGKTSFARTFGQLHYLASLGCPVPGSKAHLYLYDHLFTHFEREEDLATLRSKLEDDLVRIHEILERATPRSVLVMNESFSSATLQDALFLGKQILQRVIALDLLCVFVSFLDELSTLSEKTVSMVSTVRADDPTKRSFKIVRMPANGRAYAAAIAEKYRLSYESVKRRLAS